MPYEEPFGFSPGFYNMGPPEPDPEYGGYIEPAHMNPTKKRKRKKEGGKALLPAILAFVGGLGFLGIRKPG